MQTSAIDETMGKFRGRKLILDWGKLKIEISKLPYGPNPKDPLFSIVGSPVVLANVYETEDGRLVDDILGKPAGYGNNIEGYQISNYITDDCFWKTSSEYSQEISGV